MFSVNLSPFRNTTVFSTFLYVLAPACLNKMLCFAFCFKACLASINAPRLNFFFFLVGLLVIKSLLPY